MLRWTLASVQAASLPSTNAPHTQFLPAGFEALMDTLGMLTPRGSTAPFSGDDWRSRWRIFFTSASGIWSTSSNAIRPYSVDLNLSGSSAARNSRREPLGNVMWSTCPPSLRTYFLSLSAGGSESMKDASVESRSSGTNRRMMQARRPG